MNKSQKSRGNPRYHSIKRRKGKRTSKIPFIGLLGIAGIFIIGFFGSGRHLSPSASSLPQKEQGWEGDQAYPLMEGLIAQTRHFKGDPDTPVTTLEFSDFQ